MPSLKGKKNRKSTDLYLMSFLLFTSPFPPLSFSFSFLLVSSLILFLSSLPFLFSFPFLHSPSPSSTLPPSLNSSVVLDHKTFHRYTVRAKRGTIQSSRDSHHGSHKPRSAGASLRRYNEAALEQVCINILK